MDDELHFQLRRDTGYYHYVRRVPAIVAHLISAKSVRRTLETKDRDVAAIKAREIDQEVEAQWAAIVQAAEGEDEWERSEGFALVAESFGFDALSSDEIFARGKEEVEARLMALEGREGDKVVADALLGLYSKPEAQLSGLFKLYVRHKEHELEGYSPSQSRKHLQPKERAAAYLLTVLGERKLSAITRRDVLRFRDWWTDKIRDDGLTRDAANRSFSDIQGMLTHIDDALQTNYRAAWGGLRIKGGSRAKTRRRPPFSNAFMQKRILAPGALDAVPIHVRMAFYATIETGARPSEVCNLRPEAIKLGASIPHILVTETEERILKSENATREIPLVGVSLWAFQQCPEGFPALRNHEDTFSATMNRYLTKLKLRETPEHSVYSVRHNFYDRVHAENPGDRLETDLMGHEFGRAKYGAGSSLKQKRKLLDKIKFNWMPPPGSTIT